jgi:amino acid adenylation domain-containing protein
MFEQAAHARPHATALAMGDAALSYRALNERANRLAHRLIAMGVRPEGRVGIALDRSLEMVVGLLAILKAGGAYVPLDPAYPEQRLSYMVQDSGIGWLIARSDLRERIAAERPLTHLDLDALDLAGEPIANPEVPLHGEQLAYVIYTSGSTGRPKGVMVRHRALSHFLRSMERTPGCTARDTWLAVTSLSFDIAALELYLPLMCGARVVLASHEDARDGQALADLIAEQGVTILQSTPSTWQLLRAGGRFELPKGRLRALCGGEPMPPDLAASLTGMDVELWNMYGPTETTIWSSADRVQGLPGIGGAIADTQLRVLDHDLNLLPRGLVGELYLGGVGLARGYLARSGLTSERFVADPFGAQGGRLYRTGDLVRWRSDGQLEYIARVDHQIKIRGFRIELGEIEAQLLAQPEVGQAVALSKQDPRKVRLLAYVTATAGEHIDPKALRERLGRTLPEHMVPERIVVLEALPLSPNGKLDRRGLPDPELQQDSGYEAPQGEVEQELAQIWAEVLGVERVGRRDSFFDLGGHSLMAVQMIARVQTSLAPGLTVRDVFEAETLQEVARRVSVERAGASDDAMSEIDAFIDALEVTE